MNLTHKNSDKNQTSVQLLRKYVFSSFQNRNLTEDQDQLDHIVMEIYNWARINGAQYIAHVASPIGRGTVQKHTTFLSLKYIKQNLLQTIGIQNLKNQNLWKQSINGSILPNGNIRTCYSAKSYLIWDHLSELYILKRQKVLCVPSFLISHEGYGFDDKIFLRKAQKLLQIQISKLLQQFKIKHKGVIFQSNISQQFFILPKQFTDKRVDLQFTGRTLLGKNTLTVSSCYMKKIPQIIVKILKQAEQQLLELGVPIKYRKSGESVNQFQLCSQTQNVGSCIDHNNLKVKIIKQTCQRYGFIANFHEKPFKNIKGNQTIIKWSISYLDQKQKYVNLYQSDKNYIQLFKLLILITIKAVQQNYKLYLATITVPGNQLKFKQNQTAFPIISVFLGEKISRIIENLPIPQHKNIQQKVKILLKDFYVQANQLNSVSPISFNQNKFQFGLGGSSQNASFSLTVIMASLIKQIRSVFFKLQKGIAISDISKNLLQDSRKIRFQGDCCSKQWKEQAQKRKIYDKKASFVDYIKGIKSNGNLLIEIKIYQKKQLQAKYQITIQEYINTVKVQKESILKMINKVVLPNIYKFMQTFPRELHLKNIQNRMNMFDRLLQKIIFETEELSNFKIHTIDLDEAFKLRQKIFNLSDKCDQIIKFLPESENHQDFQQFMDKWQYF